MAGKPKIFIDGKGGVVGAKIDALLSRRDDLELLLINPSICCITASLDGPPQLPTQAACVGAPF